MDATKDRFSGFSQIVTSIDEVRSVIGEPRAPIKAKVIDHLSDICIAFIEKSPFALIASSDSQGRCEVSPRGDPVGFAQVLDTKHLAIPDRPGNRLAATFTNLIENPHLGLIFMIPGKLETLRISGEARIVRDDAIRSRMAVDGRVPAFAIVVYVEQAQNSLSEMHDPIEAVADRGLARQQRPRIDLGCDLRARQAAGHEPRRSRRLRDQGRVDEAVLIRARGATASAAAPTTKSARSRAAHDGAALFPLRPGLSPH